MENKSIIVGTIGIAVMVIILAAMIPIILDSSETIIHTAENDTDGRPTYSVTASPDISISVGSSVINVNGYELTPSRQTILAACDEWVVFTFNTSSIYVLYDGGYDSVKTGTDVSITGTNLSYTKNDSTNVNRDVVGKVIYANNVNPTYVGIVNYSTFKIDAPSVIYFFGNHTFTNSSLNPTSIAPIAFGKGTLESMEYLFSNISNVTASSIRFSADPSETSGHLTASNTFTASITNGTGTYSDNSALYGVYVPIEYKDITQKDSQIRGLIAVIPIMLLVAVLMVAKSVAFKNE